MGSRGGAQHPTDRARVGNTPSGRATPGDHLCQEGGGRRDLPLTSPGGEASVAFPRAPPRPRPPVPLLNHLSLATRGRTTPEDRAAGWHAPCRNKQSLPAFGHSSRPPAGVPSVTHTARGPRMARALQTQRNTDAPRRLLQNRSQEQLSPKAREGAPDFLFYFPGVRPGPASPCLPRAHEKAPGSFPSPRVRSPSCLSVATSPGKQGVPADRWPRASNTSPCRRRPRAGHSPSVPPSLPPPLAQVGVKRRRGQEAPPPQPRWLRDRDRDRDRDPGRGPRRPRDPGTKRPKVRCAGVSPISPSPCSRLSGGCHGGRGGPPPRAGDPRPATRRDLPAGWAAGPARG